MGRIKELTEKLNLQPHPEGGFYSETYRSSLGIATNNGQRSLATSIYFLLTSSDVSKFHSIAGEEIWFHHEGSPLAVHLLSDNGYEKLLVGPVDQKGHQPQQLVPEGAIFGSTVEEENSYALVSCVVAPGFDFRMYSAEELMENWREYAEIINRLT